MPAEPALPIVKPRPPQLDSPMVPKFIRLMSRMNVWLFRITGGRFGGKWYVGAAFPRGVPVCLLTTIGRKTGAPRTTPLLYIEDGSSVIVVASYGGMASHPLWYDNLVANPSVQVQVGRRVRVMRARVATPDERAALWPRLVGHYADFASYQSWTPREIPVVICEPA
jgi:deazaflavin-dependent oxidoreductase (nitroreductase family)